MLARSGAARFDIVPATFRHFRAFGPALRRSTDILTLRLGRSFFGPLGRRRWEADESSFFERWRILDPEPDHRLLDDVLASAKSLHPQLAGAEVVERWADLIDVMPDEVPVIDRIDEINGLVVATGCSGHGFGLSPDVGWLAAETATGRPTLVDPAPFRRNRFTRGAARAA